jgi:serine acetyltransferase
MRGLLEDLRRDAARYPSGWKRSLGFWVGATHRVGEWARGQPTALRVPVLIPWRAVTEVWRALLGVRILPGADLGPGLCLHNPRGIVLGRLRAGANCSIFEHVTVGTNANSDEFATLGSDVELGPGSRVLGPVRIGDGARIGANCVIARSVPAGTRVETAAPETSTPGSF